MITVKSTINLANQSVPNVIPVVQGDTGRSILFTLADFTIPAGATARYFITKPSGLAIYNDATIDGNTVLVDLTAQSLAEYGDCPGQVRISVGDTVVTSFEFILHVEPFRGIDAIESDTELNIFDQAIEEAVDDARERMEEAAEETIASIPEDYTALSNDVNDLKQDYSELNGRIVNQNDTLDSLNSNYYYDISEYGETNPSFTINNLSFVYDSEEHAYKINGSSSSAVNKNIYNNSTGFPGDIKPNDVVRINYIGENSTANCYILIFFYINNSWDNAVYVYSPKIIQIPSTATGMLIRIVVTGTASVTNGVLGLSMYKNASNNDLENAVPCIKPNASADLTSTIEMMLNLYGHVKLGAGTYIVNNLHMPDNSTISGCGNNTVLKTTDGTAHAIIPGAWCNIENVKIVGTKGTISSTRSVDAGIYIVGNYEDAPLKRNIKISNCTIRDFGLAGIYGKATGYWAGNSISAVNCELCYCYAGVLLEDYCEFNRFTNILTYGCYVGLMNKSGNNVFVNCSFSTNTVGVYLDCTDADTSNNNGHGAVIGATINHSNNNNGYGIIVKKVETNGFTFDTCQIWYSKIQIENSCGVIVQNCTFGGGTPLIESYTNGAFFLKNNLFKTAPTLTGTMIKDGNYLFDGSVVA